MPVKAKINISHWTAVVKYCLLDAGIGRRQLAEIDYRQILVI
jgi:hypothetical protein